MTAHSSSWPTRWRAALAGAVPERAVSEGRAYERSGRVSDVRVRPGRVSARVQGSKATPFLVEVEVPVLDDVAWTRIVQVLSGQLRHSARLLAGHAPEGLDDELDQEGISLFPSGNEVAIACGCAAAQRVCAHAAAVWEAVGERLEEEPFLLLLLRGRGRARLLVELSAARRRQADGQADGQGDGRGDGRADGQADAQGYGQTSGQAHDAFDQKAAHEDAVAVDELPAASWFNARLPLDDLALPEPEAPPTAAPTLRLLDDPPGWSGAVSAWELFAPLVAAAAAWLQRERDAQPPRA